MLTILTHRRFISRLFVATLLVSPVPAKSGPDDLPFAFSGWACSEDTADRLNGCTTVRELDFSLTDSETITVYMEFLWKSADTAKRGCTPVYLQWIYTDESGSKTRYSNYADDPRSYIFSPRSWAQPSKWKVNQTIYQDNKGQYVFSAFLDPSNTAETTLWTHVIQVGDS